MQLKSIDLYECLIRLPVNYMSTTKSRSLKRLIIILLFFFGCRSRFLYKIAEFLLPQWVHTPVQYAHPKYSY